ncbi:MAG: polysaccharide deacetylase family protein [Candidatus Eremiobacteraeota bacterium]|nr:polysaccharide deacetylase family protein [Candidatus Eremiobacteraeota bacterium]
MRDPIRLFAFVGLTLLASPAATSAPSATNRTIAAILMYHHVSDSVRPGPYGRALTVPPADFARQLALLRQSGCATVTVDTIVADVRADDVHGCEIAITFDDGYDDAVSAQRELEAQADTATLYVSTGFVGQEGHISRAQLQQLVMAGVQIGAHTIHHLDLTTLRDAAARTEIEGSRAALARWTGAEVHSFAYPAGRSDTRVESFVRVAGFRNAVTTQPGMLSTSAVSANAYALPRYRVERASGDALLARLVAGTGRHGMSVDELRTIARERSEGNDTALAERIGAALLDATYPEPLLKVRVLRVGDAAFVGIMLSGVKLHERVDRARFTRDVAGMVERAFAARLDVAEVDVWAVSPLNAGPHADVSGDYAVPTARTVFSAAVTRARALGAESQTQMLGTIYWAPGFLEDDRRE